jgi:hypothetical protein
MKKILLVCLMFAFLPLALMADITLGEYEKLSSSQKQSLKPYIEGVGIGISWANVELNETQKLYCPPEKLALNYVNYISILEEQITFTKKLFPGKEYQIFHIEMLLNKGLIRTFPCK